MLEDGGEKALDVVEEQERAQEIGIADGANDVPGQRDAKERGDAQGMSESEGGAPFPRRERPESDAATSKNDGRRAFGQRRDTQPNAKKDYAEIKREVRRGGIRRQSAQRSLAAQNAGGGREREGQRGAEEHVWR